MPNRKRNKYGSVSTEYDGIRFHSKGEAERYKQLCLLERAHEISKLELQPRFPIEVEGKRICTYIADFQYVNKQGAIIVEDFKGHRTPEYKLKSKLFRALYPRYQFLETGGGKSEKRYNADGAGTSAA